MAHRFTAAVLAVLLIMSLAVPGLTAAGEEIPVSDNGEGRLIRVAFPEIPGISEVDRYGRHTGLLMDYLNEIAKYTNWNTNTYRWTRISWWTSFWRDVST